VPPAGQSRRVRSLAARGATIRPPKFLHDLLGEETSIVELVLIACTGIIGTAVLFAFTQSDWTDLAPWRFALWMLLAFDMLAGCVANLTYSTNAYYSARPRQRLLFLAVHVQPLVFAFLLGGSVAICVAAWLYTLCAALLVNALRARPVQPVAAVSFMLIGLLALLLGSNRMPVLLLASLAFFHFKLVYSFAVDHYPARARGAAD